MPRIRVVGHDVFTGVPKRWHLGVLLGPLLLGRHASQTTQMSLQLQNTCTHWKHRRPHLYTYAHTAHPRNTLPMYIHALSSIQNKMSVCACSLRTQLTNLYPQTHTHTDVHSHSDWIHVPNHRPAVPWRPYAHVRHFCFALQRCGRHG